ncbi:CRISPR-associated protein Cas4 [Aciduliprofundum sp. MAR08-339]|uniref:CRISPR-associated protein Cas4 n=1 Tax=Aciduliprofundum sp. (strain MAR08-339) TaxID=673860 RepID=UPI0002A4C8F8|nr:CRISPR-associated protein Cas4 [Aciduliprofundum sp. MAR08-339]
MKEMHITGVKVAYYYICHTKLWLFSHDIGMERENELVSLGKLLHEKSYREHREVQIGDIAIDFIRRGEKIEVHEIKKTKKMERAHRMQILYYLYYLKKRGIEAIGVIDYPRARRREHVELGPEDEEEIERALEDIKRIVSGPMPKPKRRGICRKCAYYEFCFGGENEE